MPCQYRVVYVSALVDLLRCARGGRTERSRRCERSRLRGRRAPPPDSGARGRSARRGGTRSRRENAGFVSGECWAHAMSPRAACMPARVRMRVDACSTWTMLADGPVCRTLLVLRASSLGRCPYRPSTVPLHCTQQSSQDRSAALRWCVGARHLGYEYVRRSISPSSVVEGNDRVD